MYFTVYREPCTVNRFFYMWIKELQNLRRGKRMGGEIHFFPSLASTNREAQEQARRGAGEGAAILADSQSRGKGRLGRLWESPPGVNLYFSLVLRPDIPPAKAPQLTLMAGIAVCRALSKVSTLEARLKWPNDVLVRGRKVAGILAEMESESGRIRFVILGVGINVNWRGEDMPPSVRDTATSLRSEAGEEISRASVAGEIFDELEDWYADFLKEGFSSRMREEWNRLSWVNGKRVTVTLPDGIVSGDALGLDRNGALLLMDEQGKTHHLVVGDVSLRL